MGLEFMVRVWVTVSCRNGVSATSLTMPLVSYVLNADSGR